MFRFVKDRVVKDWPAEIKVAMDGGQSQSFDITLDIKVLPSSEYRELAGQGDNALFPEVVKGWSGICDEAGQPLPFNKENLEILAEHTGFAQAVFRAYLQATTGEASRKN